MKEALTLLSYLSIICIEVLAGDTTDGSIKECLEV